LASHAYAMTLAIAVAWARMIEERLFREHFSSYWTLAIEPGDGDSPGLLLAVDTDQRIVGADRLARLRFAIADHDINAGISLWSRFERAPSTCKWIKFGDDTPIHLDCSADASHWHGIATPPAGRLHRVPSAISARLHTRPRLGMLHSLPKAEPTPMVRGGLSSAVCRRVLAYIENNLHTPIHVDELAWQAGLSIHHFTREFSRTVGEAPHAYLLRRRLEKSAEMIENTDRPLAEIALATGFSDQSHFTRRFTRHVGMTPGAFRRARRDDQDA
jgi:AraC-like DNA-binding protein